MKQYFTDYKNWEDWQNGMWRKHDPEQEQELINDAVLCLLNPEPSMNRVIKEWPECTKVNLTNNSQNKKSWLGQAACCIEYSVPEKLTRIAWGTLTKNQQNNANKIAKEIILKWEKEQLV